MLAQVHSCAVLGIDGIPLSVEVDNYPGMNKFAIVGLPEAAGSFFAASNNIFWFA